MFILYYRAPANINYIHIYIYIYYISSVYIYVNISTYVNVNNVKRMATAFIIFICICLCTSGVCFANTIQQSCYFGNSENYQHHLTIIKSLLSAHNAAPESKYCNSVLCNYSHVDLFIFSQIQTNTVIDAVRKACAYNEHGCLNGDTNKIETQSACTLSTHIVHLPQNIAILGLLGTMIALIELTKEEQTDKYILPKYSDKKNIKYKNNGKNNRKNNR